jgi:hypothetical protein
VVLIFRFSEGIIMKMSVFIHVSCYVIHNTFLVLIYILRKLYISYIV